MIGLARFLLSDMPRRGLICNTARIDMGKFKSGEGADMGGAVKAACNVPGGQGRLPIPVQQQQSGGAFND